MLKNRLAKNAFSLLLLKGFEYMLPLITIPYLVRVLGNGNFGEMMYAIAIAYFFVTITNYGFDLTATREISIHKENLKKVNKIFSSVITVKFFLMCISFCLLSLLLFIFPHFQGNRVVYYAAFLNVIGNALFPVWLFQGIEKMGYITVVNMIAKLTTTLCIFIFVSDSSNYIIATVLQSIPLVICAFISFFIISTKLSISYSIPRLEAIVSCFKDGWDVFTSSFMSYILNSSGTIVLGLFSSKEVVGIYSAIEKLSKAIINLFAPITQALFPHISSCFEVSHKKGKQSVIKFGKWIIALAAIVALFMAVAAKWILIIFYGTDYHEYTLVVQLFAIWLLTSIANNVIGIQYLVASGRSSAYSRSFLLSTIATLILFFGLIPSMEIYGVLVSINVGELILTVTMILYIMRCKE
ncbi:flippase [Bacillus cereus group sp. MYBK15-3]|uniref:flippase n=1 Tax=Bacillus cereus group TaxID=86661 RepID=UPI000C29323A|nr:MULTISPECIES: flippase [Bacillus cereus group]USL07857.1 flippase [Bacillus bombysepticus]HDR4684001.1 flippase [Bacillus cereus]